MHGDGDAGMPEPTARELAWLRSIEPPPFPHNGKSPLVERPTASCLDAARLAVRRSRELLSRTLPLLDVTGRIKAP